MPNVIRKTVHVYCSGNKPTVALFQLNTFFSFSDTMLNQAPFSL